MRKGKSWFLAVATVRRSSGISKRGRKLATFDAGDALRSVDLSQTGRYLAGGTQNGQVLVWNVDTQELHQSFQLRHQILSVEFSPDENFVAACDGEGFRVWDLATNSVILESDRAGHHVPDV